MVSAVLELAPSPKSSGTAPHWESFGQFCVESLTQVRVVGLPEENCERDKSPDCDEEERGELEYFH